jgi:hypothetical protein
LDEQLGSDGAAGLADPEHARAQDAFWLAALDGALRGESPAVTLQRIERAAATAAPTIRDEVSGMPRALGYLADKLEKLRM